MIRGQIIRALMALARFRDCALTDINPPAPARTYDFREPLVNLKARLDDHLTEAWVAWLRASVDLYNAVGLNDTDMGLAQAAFRQDASA